MSNTSYTYTEYKKKRSQLFYIYKIRHDIAHLRKTLDNNLIKEQTYN